MGLVTAQNSVSKREITQQKSDSLISEERIPGASSVSNIWVIPDDSTNPNNERKTQLERSTSSQAKPFVKWAGGKGQLLPVIRNAYPTELGRKITKYAEPFVGGGAVLFDILSKYALESIYISDINSELMNAYKVIRDDVYGLIDILASLQRFYIPLDDERRKLYYYAKRDRFNELKLRHDSADDIENAALFIFLNKTCFNGLYRVNRKNLFNVPMGAYSNPLICDTDNLLRISTALKSVTIVHGDYRQSIDFIDKHTFAYFDPPYRPINATSNFTSYTEHSFDDGAQIMLAKYVDKLDKIGAHIVVSNSDPKNADPEDDFFDEIYSHQHIMRISATRMINSNAMARGKISELLICNY